MFFSLFVLSIIGASLALPAENVPAAGVATLGVDFIAAEENASGNKYHVYGRANWFMAQEVCASNGLRNVRINDQGKSDEVTYFIEKLTAISGPYWTLANRLYDDSTWAFAVGDPVKYFNWAAGEPNNARGNERCVEIYRNGQWNDQDCGDERFVLCESATN